MAELSPRGWYLGAALVLAVGSTSSAQKPGAPPIDSLETRARVDSNDAVVLYDLAMGYWRAKRFDDANRRLQQAVALAPQYAEAYLALSALPIARGEKYWKQVEKSQGKEAVRSAFDASSRYYRRAFLVNPMVDLGVFGILGHVEESSEIRVGNVRIQVWWLRAFNRGVNRFRDRQYVEARGLFGTLLSDGRAGKQARNLPEAVLWYDGLTAAHLGLYDSAVEDFATLTGRAMAEAQEDSVGYVPLKANDYRYTLATMLYLAGRYDQAAPTFRRALEFDIGLYPAHVQLARISEARHDWDEALQERRAAIEVNPEDPGLLTDLGITLLRAGKLEPAADALDEAMRAGPRDARNFYFAGVVALRLGRRDAARTAFSRFLEIAPSRFAPQIAETRDQLRALDELKGSGMEAR